MRFAGLLLLASLATACTGLWLWMAIAFVLPGRDPTHIAMWRVIASSFLAYCALTWASLAGAAKASLLRWALIASSLAAIAAGSYGTIATLTGAGGAHFEGYLVLMGLILLGHGVTGLLYGWWVGGSRRPAATPPESSR